MMNQSANFDFVLLQMRKSKNIGNHNLINELNVFVDELQLLLNEKKSIKKSVSLIIPKVFNLRIKAINYLQNSNEFDLSEYYFEVYPTFEKLNNNLKLSVLSENILFALRCNKRVMDSLIKEHNFDTNKASEAVANTMITTTYEQTITSLYLNIPEPLSDNLISWINSSLYIEFVILSAIVIDENSIKVSDKVINELAELVANAAQEYIAIAMEIGIIKEKKYVTHNELLSDKEFVKEQKELSNLGLLEFTKNF